MLFSPLYIFWSWSQQGMWFHSLISSILIASTDTFPSVILSAIKRRIENDETELNLSLPFCGLPSNKKILGRDQCFRQIKEFLDLVDRRNPNYSTTFVISSPSGSGKTSILQYLYENQSFLEVGEGIYYYAALNRAVDPWTTLFQFCDQNFNLSERFRFCFY